MISKIFPFNITMFTNGGLILGLVFPFISKKLRVTITVIYQLITGYRVFTVFQSGIPTIDALVSYTLDSMDSVATPIISDGVISKGESTMIILFALYPQIIVIMKFITGFLAMVSILVIIYSFVWLIAGFTEPYSCYYIYSKLGLFRLIEKTTGGRIVIDDGR